MWGEEKEYSLAELLHPVVGQAMRTEGIERRSLELMLDEMRRTGRSTPERGETERV